MLVKNAMVIMENDMSVVVVVVVFVVDVSMAEVVQIFPGAARGESDLAGY